jgi:hypothetical protein
MEPTGHGLMLELDRLSREAREARDFERKTVLDEAAQVVAMRVLGVPLADVKARVASWLNYRARDPKNSPSVQERYRDAAEFVKNYG